MIKHPDIWWLVFFVISVSILFDVANAVLHLNRAKRGKGMSRMPPILALAPFFVPFLAGQTMIFKGPPRSITGVLESLLLGILFASVAFGASMLIYNITDRMDQL